MLCSVILSAFWKYSVLSYQNDESEMLSNRQVSQGYSHGDSSWNFFSELTNALPVIQFCLCSNLKVQDHEETVSGM